MNAGRAYPRRDYAAQSTARQYGAALRLLGSLEHVAPTKSLLHVPSFARSGRQRHASAVKDVTIDMITDRRHSRIVPPDPPFKLLSVACFDSNARLGGTWLNERAQQFEPVRRLSCRGAAPSNPVNVF